MMDEIMKQYDDCAWDDLVCNKDSFAEAYEAAADRFKKLADLAEKMGTKQSAIARIESGNTNFSSRFLEKMTKAMDSKLTISVK